MLLSFFSPETSPKTPRQRSHTHWFRRSFCKIRLLPVQMDAGLGFDGRVPGPVIPSGFKWGDNRTERIPLLLAITLLSVLTRLDIVVHSVCAHGIALTSKSALSPQTWWYLRDEALDLISVPLIKSSPSTSVAGSAC